MALYVDMTLEDTLLFNFINVDQLTETYSSGTYAEYMAHWPEYQRIAVHPFTGVPMAYMLGKAEGQGENYHGHVSAVTVAPPFRRLGLGEALMTELEETSTYVHNAYFVDLFMRTSNDVAKRMYERLQYIVYRRILGYYSDGGDRHSAVKDQGDAYDMRKALLRNNRRSKSSIIPVKNPVRPQDLEWE